MEALNVKKLKKLSNYIIIEPHIGKGSFGTVYTCYEQSNLSKPLACKCLNLKFYNSNSAYIRKLKEELRLMRSINTPKVVRLIDLKRTEKDLYMIMEYVNGDNLDSLLQKYDLAFNQPPSMNLVKHVASESSLGLYYLYKHSIIHRDIKLENLMFHFTDSSCTGTLFEENKKDKISMPLELDYNIISLDKFENMTNIKASNFNVGSNQVEENIKLYNSYEIWNDKSQVELLVMNAQIKVIDLGLCKDFTQGKAGATSVCGSPITMAPEIWMNKLNKNGNQNYDYKVDIWSYGCCLYQLAVGVSPFASDEIDKICDNVMNHGKYNIPVDLGEITVEFIDFIEGMLQFDKNKRLTWEQIIEHPFLNFPVSKQLKFSELVPKLKIDNPKEASLLSSIKIDKLSVAYLQMSVHSRHNILDLGSRCTFLQTSSLYDFKANLIMLNPIEDFFYSSENKSKSMLDEISQIFSCFEAIEDYEFRENEEGYVVVEKTTRKVSYNK